MVTVVEIGPDFRRERSMPGLRWLAIPPDAPVPPPLWVLREFGHLLTVPVPRSGRLEMFAAPFPWGELA